MAEEILHDGIIPTVTTSGHGRGNVEFLKQGKIRLGSVLKPLVTMEEQSMSDHFFLHGQFHGFQHQFKRILSGKGMSHDKAIMEIFDHREKGPTLLSRNEGYIRDPLLVWLRSNELPVETIGIAMIILQI